MDKFTELREFLMKEETIHAWLEQFEIKWELAVSTEDSTEIIWYKIKFGLRTEDE